MSDTPTQRPLLRMPNTTPDWIRQAHANREQLEYAMDVATESVAEARKRYEVLCEQRDGACQLITVRGTPTTDNERVILLLQQGIVKAAEELEARQRDMVAINRELMGLR